jgi:hypothetical protein
MVELGVFLPVIDDDISSTARTPTARSTNRCGPEFTLLCLPSAGVPY